MSSKRICSTMPSSVGNGDPSPRVGWAQGVERASRCGARVAATRARLLPARMPPARRASMLIVALLACGVAAAEPIPFTAAGEHVRRLVTVEGVVARATTTPERRCVLEFDAD